MMRAGIPAEITLAPAIALIDEARCIGCTLCIQACPVDAIVGAAKLMHTVIAHACTGCELCMAPCPVDCIVVRTLSPRDPETFRIATVEAGRRYARRNARLALTGAQKTAEAASRREDHAAGRKRATIARALERARERLAARKR